jgi:hypothetical protein
MKARALVPAVLALPLLGGGAPAAPPSVETRWVHVRVEQPDQRSRVHLNLPLPAVEAALKVAPDSFALAGGTPLGRDMDLDRFRRVWKELAAVRDAELVAVEEDEARERISKRGGRLVIHLRNDREARIVDVDLPGPVVDALLSGGDQELNIRAAVAHLRTLSGEVVRVKNRDATVRLWVDESVDGLGGG